MNRHSDFFIFFPISSLHHKRGKDSRFSETEELYLLSSFNEMVTISNAAAVETRGQSSSSCLTVHHCLKQKLESDLLSLSEQLLNSYSSEVLSTRMCLLHWCILQFIIFTILYFAFVISDDKITNCIQNPGINCPGQST